MFKLILHFLVNGDWEEDSYSIRDRLPEQEEIVYHERNAYTVIKIKEVEDEYNIYDVYLD